MARPHQDEGIRRALVALALLSAIFLGLPAASYVGLKLWKRPVTFQAQDWRFRFHIAGTALAAFPLHRPLEPPVYGQRIYGGYVNHRSVAYRTAAPLRELLRAAAPLCPSEAWSREAAAASGGDALASGDLRRYHCGAIDFHVTAEPWGMRVVAHQSD